MDFDLSSAKPVTTGGSSSGGFDLSSAQPVDAKPAPAPKAATPTPDSGTPFSRASEMYGGLPEAGLGMASGAVAKPLSDIAGLGAIPLHAAGLIKTDPTEVKRKLQDTLTYEPKGPTGKAVSEYNPLSLLAKGVGAAGGAANRAIAPPSAGPVRSAIGHGVEEAITQLPNLLGAKAGDAAAARIPGKQAALDVEKGESAVRDSTRDRAIAGGYIMPAEGGVKAALQGLTGKARNEKMLTRENTDTATRNLSTEVGIPEGTPLSRENIGNRMKDAYKDYDAMSAAAGPTVTVTPKFRASIKSTLDKVQSTLDFDREGNGDLLPAQRLLRQYLKKTESTPETASPSIFKTLDKTASTQPGPPIANTIESAAAEMPGHGYGSIPAPRFTPVPPSSFAMPTHSVVRAISDLRATAKEDFAKNNSAMGKVRIGIANQLENLLEDNLAKSNNAGLVDKFRAARVNLAKLHFLDRVTNEATGKVDLPKVASLSETKAYKGVLTGAFKDAADFAKAYRKAAQKDIGEAEPRFSVFDGLFGLSALASGHPGLAAVELGGRYAIPEMTKRGMLQNRTPDYRAGTALPDVLRAGGIGAGVQPPPQ